MNPYLFFNRIRKSKIALCFFVVFSACNEDLPNVEPELKELKLAFEKLVSGRKILRQQEILNQLQNQKGEKVSNFTLKSIELDSETKKFAQLKGKNPNFEIHFSKSGTFRAKIILQRKGYKDVTIENCEFDVRAEKLIFQKFTRVLSAENTISATQILEKISGAKEGFNLKNIELSGANSENEFATVTGTKPNFTLNLLKAGKFTAKIILEKTDYFDSEITGCEFEITQGDAPDDLTFQKITQKFGENENRISSDKILAKISGTRNGYTLKNIVIPTPKATYVQKSGRKPFFNLQILKVGVFKVKLILERAGYPDVEIPNCEFEITKGDPKNLSFPKLFYNLQKGNKLNKTQILANISGKKRGYTIQSISIPSDKSQFANVTGEKPNFILNLLKKGSFTATIVLEHPNFADKSLTCSFEIVQEDFTFNPLTTQFSEDKKITATEILNRVVSIGSVSKNGYTLKSITLQPAVGFGRIIGTKLDFKIEILRAGRFTAVLELEKAGADDKTISGAEFIIQKGTARTFRFNRFVTQFGHNNNIITENEILQRVTGVHKVGYGIQQIAMVGDGDNYAQIEGKNIRLRKVGTFAVTLTLEHRDYADSSVLNCRFVVNLGRKPALIFNPFSRAFSGEKTIKTDQILAKIVLNGAGSKVGYTLKNISITPSTAAQKKGAAPDLEIEIKKAGVFTATITLEKPNYEDVILNNCQFNITKLASPTLTFPAFQRVFSMRNRTITETQILNNIPETLLKTGYALKSISELEDPSGAVRVGLRGKQMTILKPGNFKVKITLEKTNHEDVVLENCAFEISKMPAPRLTFSSPLKVDLVAKRRITESDILAKVQGLWGLHYQIKRIFNLQDLSGIAELSGAKALKIKKTGKFTANILLESRNYADVELKNCEFEIEANRPIFKKFVRLWKSLYDTSTRNYAILPLNIEKNVVLAGFRLKDIRNISDTSVAEKDAVAFVFFLKVKKAGRFTATLVFKKNGVPDVSLPNCEFEILSGQLEIVGLRNGIAKIYDGTMGKPEGTPALKGIHPAHDVRFAKGYPRYRTRGAGTNLPIEVRVRLAGADADKYQIQAPTGLTQTLESVVEYSAASGDIGNLKSKYNALTGIVIPALIDGVKMTTIGATSALGIFKDNTRLESVKIEHGITTIGNNGASGTFHGCTALKNIELPSSLRFIWGATFQSCTALTSVTLPQNLEIISTNLFYDCINLKVLNIPKSVKIIKNVAFRNCNNLEIFVEDPNGYNTIQLEISALSFGASNAKNPFIKRIKVPRSSLYNFKNHTLPSSSSFLGWGLYKDIIEPYDLLPAPVLRFRPLKAWGRPVLGEQKILQQIEGRKAGYRIKRIANISDSSLAALSGTRALKIKGRGSFTADLVLEKANFADAVLSGCKFEAVRGTFSAGGRYDDVGYSAVQADDGGFIVVGAYGKTKTTQDYFIMKIRKDGTKAWEHKSNLPYNDELFDVLKTDDGKYVAVGYGGNGGDGMVVKFEDQKNKVRILKTTFTKRGKKDVFKAIHKTTRGYVLAGYVGANSRKCNGTVLLMHPNLDSYIWQKTFGADDQVQKFHDVTEDSEGNFIAVGESNENGKYQGWAVKIHELTGAEMENKTIPQSPDYNEKIFAIAEGDSSNHFWTAGESRKNYTKAWVVELSGTEAISLESYRKKGTIYKSFRWNSILKDGNRHIVAGQIQKNFQKNFWIRALDASKMTLWEKELGGEKDENAHKIIKTDDGGYLVVGETKSKGIGGSDVWVVKLNKQGEE